MKLPEFKEFNDYYEKNPPKCVLDDTGVRHWNEVPLPAKYKKSPCDCGIIHDIADESWYHSIFPITCSNPPDLKVVKKCKKCHGILFLELIEKPPK
jgi:hypothetical protein